jgi:hypothetical protein
VSEIHFWKVIMMEELHWTTEVLRSRREKRVFRQQVSRFCFLEACNKKIISGDCAVFKWSPDPEDKRPWIFCSDDCCDDHELEVLKLQERIQRKNS